LGDNGVVASVDMSAPTGRHTAGVVAGDLVARSLALNAPGVDDSQSPVIRQGAPTRADLTGNLRVTGSLDTTSLRRLSGAAGPSFSAGAPTRADLAGSLRVTGNIDTTGTVNTRNVAADGTKLDQHLANTANPHGTTAAQVGALALTGGTVNGQTTVNGQA